MLATAFLILAPLLPAQEEEEARGKSLVFRVDRIESLAGDPVTNGAVVVREGVIERLGAAVVIPDGAEVHDLRGTGSTLMPPLVLSHANFLVHDSRGRGRNGRFRAVDSLWLGEDELEDLLEEGVLLMGVDPPGTGIPGRTSVLSADAGHPVPEAMVNDLHLKLTIDANSGAKDILRKALEDADKAIEKEKKAREDWEKARKEWEEKQKQKAEEEKKKQEEAKKEQGGGSAQRPQAQGQEGQQGQKAQEEKAPPEKFEPPEIDPNLLPVVEWIRKQRMAQIWLSNAADWLHWKDVLGERELPYEVVLSHSAGFRSNLPTQNYHYVLEDLAAAGVRVYVPATISFLPDTRIRTNLPAEVARAGVSMVLDPRYNSPDGVRSWRVGVADVVREGLDRATALKAMTLEPAAAMGQEGKVKALEAGGPATFVIFAGDVLDPVSEVSFVVRDGEVLFDRAEKEKEESR